MNIASRTPEGRPNRCPTCGKEVQLEPSVDSPVLADAPCPHCGCLIWFAGHSPAEQRQDTDVTRSLIRNSVGGFAATCKSTTDPVACLQELLAVLVHCLAAHGGANWTPLEMRMQIGIGQRMLSWDAVSDSAHIALIAHALVDGKSQTISPLPPESRPINCGNTTGSLLLLDCVKKNSQTVALVEIFQRAYPSPNVQRGYVRFVRQMCELAEASRALDHEIPPF